MAIDLNNANLYYSKHHRSGVWSAFSVEMRTASIASARRILSRGLGRGLRDTEAVYVEGDQSRDEYAVYEQALYLLENGRIVNPGNNTPYPTAMPESGVPEGESIGSIPLYSPDALRWLGNFNAAVVIRG